MVVTGHLDTVAVKTERTLVKADGHSWADFPVAIQCSENTIFCL